MSINSVGNLNGYIHPCGSKLSEETRRKLIALGIDPSTVASEAQAQILIAQLEELKKQAKIQPINTDSNINRNLNTEENENFTTGNCEETETIKGARGASSYNNIHIHSVRMPGFMASQEVIFGSNGQTLRIRPDSTDRKCYMNGVLLAIRYIGDHKEFVYGLDNIM